MPNAPSSKLDEFAASLPSLCGFDTTSDEHGWTMRNPMWGHSAVVALAAQDRFGGSLMRGKFMPYSKYVRLGDYYWNRLPDGTELDLTLAQFGNDPPAIAKGETCTRADALGDAAVMKRYKLLSWLLARFENRGNQLFANNIFRHCYMTAMASISEGSRIGCLLMRRDNYLAAETCNTLVEGTIDTSGNAEQSAIRCAADLGTRLDECDLYIVGVRVDGSPVLKERAEYTDLRCATMIHDAGIQRIHVPVGNHWESLTTEQALLQSKAHATRQRNT